MNNIDTVTHLHQTAGDGATADKPRPTIERINRVDRPVAGDYWRAKREVVFTDPETGKATYQAKADTVLLIREVRLNKTEIHTVVLSRHPKHPAGGEWILVNDFLEAFDYAPDGADVRAREMAELQGEITVIQNQIARASSDQTYMNTLIQEAIAAKPVEETSGLPANLSDLPPLDVLVAQAPTLSQALSSGSTALVGQAIEVVRSAQQVAKLQDKWFGSQIAKITNVTTRMTPFLMEQAAVAIARTSTAVAAAGRLMESVTTMTLFGGEHVTCTCIVEGVRAPAGTPVKLFQRKLWTDEELSYLSQYQQGLDITEFHKFVEELSTNKALQDLILPCERGAVLMGVSRRNVYYGDSLAESLRALNVEKANKETFILVRDGASFFTIDSPIPDHKAASRFFPEKDIDGTIFTGIKGDSVTVDDLRWTQSLDDLHQMAVLYRRFALVLAGRVADGKFWEGANFMDFFTGVGNSRLFQLVADDSYEDSLPSPDAETLQDFITRIKAGVRAGSLVLVWMPGQMNNRSVAKAFSEYWDRHSRQTREARHYVPINTYEVGVVRSEGNSLFINAPFKHEATRKVTNLRIYLTKQGKELTGHLSWMPLDRLETATLDRLMASREQRSSFLEFMHIFRRARDHANTLQAAQAPLAEKLSQELVTAGLATAREAARITQNALEGWRADGGAFPLQSDKDQDALRLLAFRLTKAGRFDVAEVAAAATAKGLNPIRLALTGDGRAWLFTEDTAPDNRIFPQADVLRWAVEPGARGIKINTPVSDLVYAVDPSLTIVHEWPSCATFAVTEPPTLTKRRKADLIADVERRFAEDASLFFGPLDESQQQRYINAFTKAFKKVNDPRKYYADIAIEMPLAIVYGEKRISILSITTDPINAAAFVAPEHLPALMKLYGGTHNAHRRQAVESACRFEPGRIHLTSTGLPDWADGRDAFSTQNQNLYTRMTVYHGSKERNPFHRWHDAKERKEPEFRVTWREDRHDDNGDFHVRLARWQSSLNTSRDMTRTTISASSLSTRDVEWVHWVSPIAERLVGGQGITLELLRAAAQEATK